MSGIGLKVLIIVTSQARMGGTGKPTGYYLPEVSHPYYAFAEAGIAVDFASPRGGKAPMDPASADRTDPANARFLDDAALMGRLDATLSPAQVDPGAYAAVFYAGGHGTMWDFPGDAGLARLAASVYEKGGVVSAVCHGPAGLVDVRLSDGRHLVDGKELTAFTNEEEDAVGLTGVVPFALESKLIERGGRFKKAANFAVNVVTSGRLVTGQNPASAAGTAKEVVRLLKARP